MRYHAKGYQRIVRRFFALLYLHYNVAFTFKWYGNCWNKTFRSQRIWIDWVNQFGPFCPRVFKLLLPLRQLIKHTVEFEWSNITTIHLSMSTKKRMLMLGGELLSFFLKYVIYYYAKNYIHTILHTHTYALPLTLPDNPKDYILLCNLLNWIYTSYQRVLLGKPYSYSLYCSIWL